MLYRIAVTLAALSGVQALRYLEDEANPTLAGLEPNNDYKDKEFKSLSGNEISVSDVLLLFTKIQNSFEVNFDFVVFHQLFSMIMNYVC